MNIAFYNGNYMPLDEVKLSPLDRGFLFGEGIYEVIPVYDNKLIALDLHVERLWQGLALLDIKPEYDQGQLAVWCQELVKKNALLNQSIYIHVTRGIEKKRFHGWDNSGKTTLFMMSNSIVEVSEPEIRSANSLEVSIEADRRWRNCHIKSTSLLGNVLHFQKARETGYQEVLLTNDNGNVTEASTSNVFIVKGSTVKTPPLSTDLLPGVTRNVMLSILRKHSHYEVLEKSITVDELLGADEVWLTSSSKGVAPVIRVEEQPIANGAPGKAWLLASQLYFKHKFDY